MTELNKDYFCSANKFVIDRYGCFVSCLASFGNGCNSCKNYHRKWPTERQFEEEYGFKWPDDGAVYAIPKQNPILDGYYLWTPTTLHALSQTATAHYFVIACTPWGCPPADWRPE